MTIFRSRSADSCSTTNAKLPTGSILPDHHQIQFPAETMEILRNQTFCP